MAVRLCQWAGTNLREFPWRDYTTEYEITIAELLLQRTRAEVVARFIGRFLSQFSDWAALSSVDPSELESALSPLGLQARRAATLQKVARARLEGLDDLPGVGQYVGRARDVMLSGARVAMVDTNFVRILQRVFDGPWMSDYRYDSRLQALAQALVLAAPEPRLVNLAVLDFGATVCRPRSPRCGECPLLLVCEYGRDQLTSPPRAPDPRWAR